MNQYDSVKWWAAFSCIAFIEAVLLMILLSGKASIELFLAITVIAMLLFLFPSLDDTIALTFDRSKLESKLSAIGKKNTTTMTKLDKLILLSMSTTMCDNLKKLNSGQFGTYKITERLERELYHLWDLGYIEVSRVRDIPYEGNNLSEYVQVTDFGKQFVELRKSVESEMNS
ncbi:MAG: hypothetical protein SAK29_22695 [Scytonema sp. PMC 1069.18]|nr:hypothetical protein [Scytonema sp. PMC 1069.18]MEC4884024.1 hypothetical protein [Scytonema sp. PMC 1070.18]